VVCLQSIADWKNKSILEKLYLKKEMSQNKIAKQLKCSTRTIQTWMKNFRIKSRDRGLAVSIAFVKPNLKPSISLSYVLGVLLGDGSTCIYKDKYGDNHYNVSLSVKNIFFAKEFNKSLRNIGLHPTICFDAQRKYRVTAYSKFFVDWFRKIGLNDIEKLLSRKSYILFFVKGFYESEGSYIKSKKLVSISNTNHDLLLFVQKILLKTNIKSNVYGPYRRKHNFDGYKYFANESYLLVSKQNESKKFIKLVNPIFKNSF